MTYVVHELDTGIEFLAFRRISPVDHHADIGNDAEEIILVFLVGGQGVIVIGGEQNLRSGAFPVLLLVFVQCLLQELIALLQYKFIQFRQIGGIVPDGIFDQQNGLHSDFQDIIVRILLVLEQFDDGQNQISVSVPAEYEIDS